MEEKKDTEIEEVNEDLMEIEKVGFAEKAKYAIKTHGKKILAVVGVATVGLIGYALGRKPHADDSEDTVETPAIEADWSDVDETE